MLRINAIRVICIVLIFAVSLSMLSCSNPKDEISDLIDDFESACNRLDFSEALELIDPKVSKKIRYATGFLGLVTNTQTDEIFDLISNWILKDYDVGADLFKSVKIDVDGISISGNKANVSVTLHFDMAGNEMEENATFVCVRRSGQWYISDFSIR